jgi:acyl dehydratase
MAEFASVTRESRSLQVGDTLAEVVRGPITRGDLALFAGASNDHTLFHIDSDYAKAIGLDDVFAQGMLSMAYLAQVLTQAFRPEQLREWSVRFLAITVLYATVHCSGEVIELFEADGERRARIRLAARTDTGLATLVGSAVVALG